MRACRRGRKPRPGQRQRAQRIDRQRERAHREDGGHRQGTPVRCDHRAGTYQQRNTLRRAEQHRRGTTAGGMEPDQMVGRSQATRTAAAALGVTGTEYRDITAPSCVGRALACETV